jgi:hypothetical protein
MNTKHKIALTREDSIQRIEHQFEMLNSRLDRIIQLLENLPNPDYSDRILKIMVMLLEEVLK